MTLNFNDFNYQAVHVIRSRCNVSNKQEVKFLSQLHRFVHESLCVLKTLKAVRLTFLKLPSQAKR
jgi:hypothetical protein